MALFYLIRHGEPDYESVSKLGFYGFGRSFAPLSEHGLKQAEEVAMLGREFQEYKGVYPKGQEMRWETLSSLKIRIKRVADKYADYNKVMLQKVYAENGLGSMGCLCLCFRQV